MPKLGEFELLVLLSLLRHGDEPYANHVRDDLLQNAGRRVTRGALYRTLDRLVEKGFVEWESEASGVPERGGRPRRRVWVTGEGLAAVRGQRDVLETFFSGLRVLLDDV